MVRYSKHDRRCANKQREMQSAGLILAAGGGLNIGREGPYTHLGGMVSYQLIRNVPWFKDILTKESVLRQVCMYAEVAVTCVSRSVGR